MDIKSLAQSIIGVLNDRGWAQGQLETINGQVCIFGAFNIAQHGYSYWGTDLLSGNPGHTSKEIKEFSAALIPVIRDRFPARLHGAVMDNLAVVRFNNDPATTKEDVIGVLQELVAA